MKLILTISVLFISLLIFAQKKVETKFIFGLDYRLYPVDIEDVGFDNVTSNGLNDDSKFWESVSLMTKGAYTLKSNWQLSATFYTRYNHLNWLEGVNLSTATPNRRKEKKNFKYDLFIDIEKKLQLKKGKERYLTILAGVGFTNINTRFDVTLQDTLEDGSLTSYYNNKGTYLHFGPRISIGYQYEKIKASLNVYIIEGPDLNNLTSLWPGISLGYELDFKRKRKKKF